MGREGPGGRLDVWFEMGGFCLGYNDQGVGLMI